MTFYRFTVSVVAALSGLIMAQNLVFAQQTGVQDRVLEWPDGTRYEGGVLNGKKEGQGVITWSDGTRLEGNFSNDMLDGPARMILPDGTVLTGSFTGNQLIAEAVDEPVADSEDSLNYSDELENEIVAVLDAWASAWSAQNPALYLSFYSDNFQVPDGLSREVWENQRRERIRSPEFIQVDVGYAQFEIVDGNALEVYLHQGYTSNSYSDFTNKLVTLRREDGLWKILQEVTL